MTTTNLTIHCDGMDSYGPPSYLARRLGRVAVELVDVNIPALIEYAMIEVGADTILDEIPTDKIMEYLNGLGYRVEE